MKFTLKHLWELMEIARKANNMYSATNQKQIPLEFNKTFTPKLVFEMLQVFYITTKNLVEFANTILNAQKE